MIVGHERNHKLLSSCGTPADTFVILDFRHLCSQRTAVIVNVFLGTALVGES